MLFCMIVSFVAFTERSDSIFKKITDLNSVHISASGSLGFKIRGKCIISSPNATISTDKYSEWCSNLGKSKEEK